MILSPEHLAINNSTARINNDLLSNSGMAQSYFGNSALVGLSLYSPYGHLTDSRIYTSGMQFYLPTYNWGTLKFSYTDNSNENFNKPVYSNKMVNLGYAKNITQRLITAATFKWNSYTWYSDIYPELSTNGFSLNINSIFIVNGYSSVGIALENIYRSEYSKNKNDGEPRTVRLGYNRVNKADIISWEAGYILSEDSEFNYQSGGYLSSILTLPYAFTIGAEYKYLNNHEFGTFLGFNYHTNSFNAYISYALRIDNSPLPMTSYKHALGIQFSLNQIKKSKSVRNPQYILRDDQPPAIFGKRLSSYRVLIRDNQADILKVAVHAKDNQSGLANVKMTIVALTDTNRIVYVEDINIDNRSSIEDTLYFNSKLSGYAFQNNEKYLLRFIALDLAGNNSLSDNIPFQILDSRNDMEGPTIEIDFDTTNVNIGLSVENYAISSKASITDSPGTPLTWQLTLYRSNDDSIWIPVKTVKGNDDVHNQKFQWSLGKNSRIPISGWYKIYIEAYDIFNNKTAKWSGTKNIYQERSKLLEEDNIQIESTGISVPALDTNIVKDDTVRSEVSTNSVRDQYYVNTTYSYHGKIVELSDFIFEYSQPFNPYVNSNGLHIIGVHLQDLPNSYLIVQSSTDILNIPESLNNLINFFNETYNISKNRIKFSNIKGKNKLNFLIEE